MTKLNIHSREIYLFTSPYIGERMYVMLKEDKALVVDPHYSLEILTFLKQNSVQEITVFLTHEHPDHTNGVPLLKEHFNTKIICQKECAEAVVDKRNNLPKILEMILLFQDEKNGTRTAEEFKAQIQNYPLYALNADITFDDVYEMMWQGEKFVFQHTPGHTQGSCCIVWNNKVVFTGDSLLKDMPVITRFPGGNTKQYNDVTKPYLDSLPDDMVVLPGHGESFIMKEIRKKAA